MYPPKNECFPVKEITKERFQESLDSVNRQANKEGYPHSFQYLPNKRSQAILQSLPDVKAEEIELKETKEFLEQSTYSFKGGRHGMLRTSHSDETNQNWNFGAGKRNEPGGRYIKNQDRMPRHSLPNGNLPSIPDTDYDNEAGGYNRRLRTPRSEPNIRDPRGIMKPHTRKDEDHLWESDGEKYRNQQGRGLGTQGIHSQEHRSGIENQGNYLHEDRRRTGKKENEYDKHKRDFGTFEWESTDDSKSDNHRKKRNSAVSFDQPEKKKKHKKKKKSKNKHTKFASPQNSGNVNVQPSNPTPYENHNINQPDVQINMPKEPGEEENEGEEEEKENENRWFFWDLFKELDEEVSRYDVYEEPALQFIKAILYLFFFLLTLGTLVVHKVSLLLLVVEIEEYRTEVNEEKRGHEKTVAYFYLAIAICIPYGLGFLLSIAKVVFGTYKMPSFKTIILSIINEGAHTLGLCLLVFRVLPKLDTIRGLMLLSGTAFLPSLLKISMAWQISMAKTPTWRLVLRWIVDAVALVVQMLVLPLIVLMKYVTKKNGDSIETDYMMVLEVAGGIILTSFTYWENYTDGRFFVNLNEKNIIKRISLKMRYELQEGRHKLGILTNPIKIGLTLYLAYQLKGDTKLDIEGAFDYLSTQENIKANSEIIACTISGFFGFLMAYTICKFQMQKISLVLSLLLATPGAWALLYFDCKYEFMSAVSHTDTACPNFNDIFSTSDWHVFAMGAAWWLSLLILTRHLLRPTSDRTADMARLFINPIYCGILTTEAIMLNRRRQPQKVIEKHDFIKKEGTDTEIHLKYYDLEREIHDQENNYKDEEGPPPKEQGTPKNPIHPMIYMCATMWHETTEEMTMLLKSLHRIDKDQCIRRETMHSVDDPDFYNFEAHIFFDDCMELDEQNNRQPNKFVKQLHDCMSLACSSVYGRDIQVHSPLKIPTPYGGQLIWKMPGDNLLFVHMKDMSRIRNRKRWSQVMYMYYLLGYRLTLNCKAEILEKARDRTLNESDATLNEMLGDQQRLKSENTYILALDGDTDFLPGSIQLLLDRMKDENVGAACGRIHPVGTGPMIWYQKFEYAIGHWLQKSAEHVFGCVLCSPGCFSLFRASALMATSVMKRYTTEPTEPSHHLQYDQGEDRWLCTLMLQQGYRIEYAAGADAWTVAPEGFYEFFNQRRRWMPSTIANILDLLKSSELTRKRNPNISMLYIFYQSLLMLMTILGPGTILMMIAGAIKLVFAMTLVDAYLFTTIPVAVYVFFCFFFKQNVQLAFAALLSVFYAFIMLVVLVGTIVTATTNSLFHPSVIVILALLFIFLSAGICHPKEIACLLHGGLYMLVIPSGYLLLVIYSICNLNDVSWGTREVLTKAQRDEQERKKQEKERLKAQKNKKTFLQKIFGFGEGQLKQFNEILSHVKSKPETNDQNSEMMKLITRIERNTRKILHESSTDDSESESDQPIDEQPSPSGPAQPWAPALPKRNTATATAPQPQPEQKPKMENWKTPYWIKYKGLGNGDILQGNSKEMKFWKNFINKYLLPIKPSADEKKKIADGLKDLRNSASFGMIIINLLWMALNFMFQLTSPATITFTYTFTGKEYTVKESILGMLFVFILILLLLVQLVGMAIHRLGTVQQLIAITEISFHKSKNVPDNKKSAAEIRKAIEGLLKIPSENDENMTTPPEFAESEDDLGRTVLPGASRLDRTNIPSFNDTLAQSIKQFGNVITNSQRNQVIGRQSNILLKSIRNKLEPPKAYRNYSSNVNRMRRRTAGVSFIDQMRPPVFTDEELQKHNIDRGIGQTRQLQRPPPVGRGLLSSTLHRRFEACNDAIQENRLTGRPNNELFLTNNLHGRHN